MDIKDRFFQIRTALDLSQEKFGALIGLSKSSISNIEAGQRAITDRHILLLESQLNVNPSWLTDGEGDMFKTADKDDIEKLVEGTGLNNERKELLYLFLSLPPEDQKIVKKKMLELSLDRLNQDLENK